MLRTALLSLLLLCSAACLKPLPLRDELVMAEVMRRYDDFYPGKPTEQPDSGLVRPRFGVPVIAQTGAAFSIEVLAQPGSGLAGLTFAALAAHGGTRVLVLEAHTQPGGYGHTFSFGRGAIEPPNFRKRGSVTPIRCQFQRKHPFRCAHVGSEARKDVDYLSRRTIAHAELVYDCAGEIRLESRHVSR